MKQLLFIFYLMAIIPLSTSAQSMVSYAYDYAGNRIQRKILPLRSNSTHVKKDSISPAPVEDQLGEHKIAVFPNPTKGALAVEITGGDIKDQIRLLLFSAQGTQLQNIIATNSITTINMALYPSGWYILRVQAGEKLTEFKIVKQ